VRFEDLDRADGEDAWRRLLSIWGWPSARCGFARVLRNLPDMRRWQRDRIIQAEARINTRCAENAGRILEIFPPDPRWAEPLQQGCTPMDMGKISSSTTDALFRMRNNRTENGRKLSRHRLCA